MRILCSMCGAEAWGFALEQEVYRLPVSVGGAAKQSQGLHKMSWGMGKVAQAQAVQQSAVLFPHKGLCGLPTSGSKQTLGLVWGSPAWQAQSREAAGVIARYRCCVSS